MGRTIDVCLSPSLLDQYEIKEKFVIIVDILRAGSCIATGLAHGVKKIKPVADLEEALALRKKGYIVAGERGGVRIEGFDMGNSPFEFMSRNLRGASVAMTTTNGTNCLRKSEKAAIRVIGSFLNLSGTVEYLLSRQLDILVLCAGWNGSVNLEDTLYAGALVEELSRHLSVRSDSGRLSQFLFRQAKNNLRDFLKEASHVKRLLALNSEEDIEYCLQQDLFSFPIVMEDGFVVKK